MKPFDQLWIPTTFRATEGYMLSICKDASLFLYPEHMLGRTCPLWCYQLLEGTGRAITLRGSVLGYDKPDYPAQVAVEHAAQYLTARRNRTDKILYALSSVQSD